MSRRFRQDNFVVEPDTLLLLYKRRVKKFTLIDVLCDLLKSEYCRELGIVVSLLHHAQSSICFTDLYLNLTIYRLEEKAKTFKSIPGSYIDPQINVLVRFFEKYKNLFYNKQINFYVAMKCYLLLDDLINIVTEYGLLDCDPIQVVDLETIYNKLSLK